jgi:hypothetical protein
VVPYMRKTREPKYEGPGYGCDGVRGIEMC